MTTSEFTALLLLTGFRSGLPYRELAYTRPNGANPFGDSQILVWLLPGKVQVTMFEAGSVIDRQNFTTRHNAWRYIQTLIGE